jgi:hypothetical protein
VTPEELMTLAVQVGRIEQKLEDRDNKLDAIHRSLKDDIAVVDKKVDKVDVKISTTNGRVKAGELKDAEIEGMFRVFAWCSPFIVAAFAAILAYFLT